MQEQILRDAWPEWQIVRRLGKGAYGVVYEAVRSDYVGETRSAIKVISIPKDETEIETLHSKGLSDEGTRTYLQGIVNDFVSEIRVMESLKGVQNIVSVEDYKLVEKTDSIGWDICIRMELLTPLNTYLSTKALTEREIITLGIDICTALERCGQLNIIHRDIKPENIFVNKFNDFKLGDFGIARKLENLSSGLSQKGTPDYIAPEVVRSVYYDSRADIYSLGLVLYRLTNAGLPPFLDQSQIQNPYAHRTALERRLNGEPLPPPLYASENLARVILCACAPNPDDRYLTATAMKKDLRELLMGGQAAAAPGWGDTVVLKDAAPQPSIVTNGTVSEFGAKKSKLPLILALSLGAAVLVIAGILILPGLLKPKISVQDSSSLTESRHFVESAVSEAPSTAAPAESSAAEKPAVSRQNSQEYDTANGWEEESDSFYAEDESSEPSWEEETGESEAMSDLTDNENEGSRIYAEKDLLLSLCPTITPKNASMTVGDYGPTKDNTGVSYKSGLGGTQPNIDNTIDYVLDGQYRRLTGRVVLNFDSRATTHQDLDSYLYIYCDGRLARKYGPVLRGFLPEDIDLDVTGVQQVRLVIHGKNYIRLVDANLSGDLDGKIYSTAKAAKAPASRLLADFVWFSSNYHDENESTESWKDWDHPLQKGAMVFENYASSAEGGFFDGPVMRGVKVDTTHGEEDNWNEYYLNGAYSKFSFTVFLNREYRDKVDENAHFRVYCDGELRFDSGSIYGNYQAKTDSVDLTGVKILKVSINGCNYIRVANCYID